MIKAILAVDSNYGIGKNNSLPWHFKEDLQYFKQQTTGHYVVMGNNTWSSLPSKVKPLPNRTNVVITSCHSNQQHDVADIVLVSDNNSLQAQILALDKIDPLVDTWIIGGASIYKQLMPIIDELHLTSIQGVYNCDTFFNPFVDTSCQFSLQETITLIDQTLVVNIYKRV